MTYGTSWGFGADKEESRRIFRHYLDSGGNFIDTANVYTGGESETFIGEFIGADRDQVVIGTKYSLMTDEKNPNSLGNHPKNLRQSVRDSLSRLRCGYIDILWVHAWYFEDSIDDVLIALDALVREGTILYWGVSDAPAWICAQLLATAKVRGWAGPVGIQVEYSLQERSAERELLPFASYNKLGVLGWGPLAAGLLTGKHTGPDTDTLRAQRVAQKRDMNSGPILDALGRYSTELGCTAGQLAIRWVQKKAPNSVPILGARTTRQLEETVRAADVDVPDEVMIALDDASKINPGFPGAFLNSDRTRAVMYGSYPSCSK
jgi:aryl-alcohol dehydrogenase-like predicted oxidoreductase